MDLPKIINKLIFLHYDTEDEAEQFKILIMKYASIKMNIKFIKNSTASKLLIFFDKSGNYGKRRTGVKGAKITKAFKNLTFPPNFLVMDTNFPLSIWNSLGNLDDYLKTHSIYKKAIEENQKMETVNKMINDLKDNYYGIVQLDKTETEKLKNDLVKLGKINRARPALIANVAKQETLKDEKEKELKVKRLELLLAEKAAGNIDEKRINELKQALTNKDFKEIAQQKLDQIKPLIENRDQKLLEQKKLLEELGDINDALKDYESILHEFDINNQLSNPEHTIKSVEAKLKSLEDVNTAIEEFYQEIQTSKNKKINFDCCGPDASVEKLEEALKDMKKDNFQNKKESIIENPDEYIQELKDKRVKKQQLMNALKSLKPERTDIQALLFLRERKCKVEEHIKFILTFSRTPNVDLSKLSNLKIIQKMHTSMLKEEIDQNLLKSISVSKKPKKYKNLRY